MALHLGFFKDFKQSDAVLLDGTFEDLIGLLSRLGEFVNSSDAALAIHEVSLSSRKHPANLFAIREPSFASKSGSDQFFWLCSPEDLYRIESKINNLLSIGAGHLYFELVGSETLLVVSLGEYGDAWWDEYG